MVVEVFSLCDAATADSGKLNVLGAFDTLWAAAFPVSHPQCAIALRLRFAAAEGEQHQIAVNIIDLDGKHIIPSAGGVINLQFSPELRTASANVVLNIHMLRLERPAEYAIDLHVDGVQAASIPLFVRQVPAPAR